MRAREVNRRIERLGGKHVRTVGSHKRYKVSVNGVTVSTAVPQHPGEIPTGTLRKIEEISNPPLAEGGSYEVHGLDYS